MRYWWVNHKQTFRQESSGGYLWAPKTKANGAKNQFYDNMAVASPSDLVISYAEGRVRLFGRVEEAALTTRRPTEFKKTGEQWGEIGWLLPVTWFAAPVEIKPSEVIDTLRPYLPKTHSPIRSANGYGNQGAYLAEIGEALFASVAEQSNFSESQPGRALYAYDAQHIEEQELSLATMGLSDTEAEQVTKSRRGHGQFRANTLATEPRCRVTGLVDPSFMIASHIKPWRHCDTAAERLDGNNGLMLAPHVDRLFDRGFMTFLPNGSWRFSDELDGKVIAALRLDRKELERAQPFNTSQAAYLKWHHEHIFRGD